MLIKHEQEMKSEKTYRKMPPIGRHWVQNMKKCINRATTAPMQIPAATWEAV